MFGTDALPLFRAAGFQAAGADLPEVDITSRESLGACMRLHLPDVVVNAAGYTQVDAAEANASEAFRVNAEGTGNVAEACREAGALLIHLSTEYVFPGERSEGYLPADDPGPALNAYGASKLEGEKALMRVLSERNYLLCRTQWLFGRRGRCFASLILDLARSRPEIRVVDDQWGVPTGTADLARQIMVLLNRGSRGIVHTVGGGGPITWRTFAAAIVEFAGLPCRIVPCTSEEFPRPAMRPRFAWLRNAGVPESAIRPWRDALAEHLAAVEATRNQ